MNISIKSIHFSADRKLEELIQSKINKLTQFHDSIIGANVYLRLEKSQDLENKITEINRTGIIIEILWLLISAVPIPPAVVR